MNSALEPQASPRARVFALVFAPCVAILYWISDVWRFPVFSYYPANNHFAWGWTPSTPDDGPAMYWYGWIVTSALGAALIACVVSALPDAVTRKIPASLSWLIPTLLVPAMLYSLKFYWR